MEQLEEPFSTPYTLEEREGGKIYENEHEESWLF